jgi:hypothetical protein
MDFTDAWRRPRPSRSRRGTIRLKFNRHRTIFAGVAVAIALLVVPSAFAFSSRNYVVNRWLDPLTAYTDGVNHNHKFNELYTDYSWPTGIYEKTANTNVTHYALNGNGWISLWHDGVYFDHPFCWNRQTIPNFAIQCDALW